jgi:hypothetical protein
MGNGNEDDVWYHFTATSSKIRFIYSNLQPLLGNPATVGYAIYKDNCPSGSSSFLCSNNFGFLNGKTILEGFEQGAGYLLRLWGVGADNFIQIQMCLQAVIPPPNDECVNAINLPVGKGFCTDAKVINLFDATTSAGFNASPSCRGGSRTEDVWFTAIVPQTGNLIVETSPANPNVPDLVMEAFTGNCGSLTALACDDNSNPNPGAAAAHPRLVFTGRTPGEKLTFRVVSVTEAGMGRFATYAIDTTSSVLPPVAAAGSCTPADSIFIHDTLANGYRWVPVFNQSGQIVAEVYADSHQPDTIATRLNVLQNMPLPMVNGKYHAGRIIEMKGMNGGSLQRVRLHLKTEEIDSLRKLDSTLAGITNLSVRSDTTNCEQGILRQVKSYNSVWSAYGPDYRMEITPVPDISIVSYYFNSACGTTITWTGTTNTNWHEPTNWDCGGVPYRQSKVLIPSGVTLKTILGRSTEIESLFVYPGMSVEVLPQVHLLINKQNQ